MFEVPPFVLHGLEWMATMFVFMVGVGLLVVAGMFVYDRLQTSNTIRRNYPVVGRFRGAPTSAAHTTISAKSRLIEPAS